jgi:hypothetical protein
MLTLYVLFNIAGFAEIPLTNRPQVSLAKHKGRRLEFCIGIILWCKPLKLLYLFLQVFVSLRKKVAAYRNGGYEYLRLY